MGLVQVGEIKDVKGGLVAGEHCDQVKNLLKYFEEESGANGCCFFLQN
jgi:hypothetical protein